MTTQTANWQIRGAAMELIAAKFAMDGGKHLVKTTWDIYTRLTAVKHPNCNVLGELVSLDFLELLNSSDMSLTVACRYFTMIHDLFHHSAQRYSDMRRFDQLAVVPFVRWLRDHYPVLTFSNIPNFHSNLNIGYLCTWGILLPGNPVASIQNLLISKHGTLSKRTIFTYLTSFANSEFVAGLSNTTVRDIRQGYTFESLDSAVKQILADKIDVFTVDGAGSDEVGSAQLVEILIVQFTNRRPVFERLDHIHRADHTASLNLPAHVGRQAIANDPLERPASCFIRANVERPNRVGQVANFGVGELLLISQVANRGTCQLLLFS
jgi:hypothetical protein